MELNTRQGQNNLKVLQVYPSLNSDIFLEANAEKNTRNSLF